MLGIQLIIGPATPRVSLAAIASGKFFAIQSALDAYPNEPPRVYARAHPSLNRGFYDCYVLATDKAGELMAAGMASLPETEIVVPLAAVPPFCFKG